MPVRGASSISRMPASRRPAARPRCRRPGRRRGAAPGPRLARNLPTGVSVAERREQLHVVLADVEQHRLDALLGDHLAVHQLHAVGGRVELERRVEVGDGDADVVDAAEHRPESTLTRACESRSRQPASGGGLDPEPLARRHARARRRGRGLRLRARRARAPAATAPDRLAVAGGDGTIGPAAELAGRLGAPLAVIPTGTANDFARANGLPRTRSRRPRSPPRAGATRRSSSAGSPTGARSSTSPAPASPPRRPRTPRPLKPVLGPLAYGVGALRAAATAAPDGAASASTASPASPAAPGR